MIVEGNKAGCVVLVEASHSWRGKPADETRPRAGRRKRRSVRAARKVPKCTDATVSASTDEPPAAPGTGCLALHLLRCRQLRVIRKHGARPPVALSKYRRHCQSSDGTVGAERRGIGRNVERDCKCSARMRPPPPTAATMRVERWRNERHRASRSGTRTTVTERGGAALGR